MFGSVGTPVCKSLLEFFDDVILGASLTPYIATKLATAYGLHYVGHYLSVAAVLSVIGLLAIRETKNEDFSVGIEGP